MTRSIRHTVTVAAAIACVCTAVPAAAQPAPTAAGFIVDLKGRWSHVRAGDAVPAARKAVVNAGDTLQRRDDDPGSYIVVALYTGDTAKYVVTTTVPGRAESGPIGRIVRAIQQRFQSGFVSASSRGGSEVSDAVVEAGADRIDVSAALKSLPAGDYAVSTSAVVDGTVSSNARASAHVTIAPSGAITIPSLPPGVYELNVSGANPADGGRAWILVVAPDRYPDAARAFLTRPGASAGADRDMQAAARALARAYLIVLDEAARSSR